MRFPGRHLALALILATSGCTCGGKGDLSGTVTYQGKTVAVGSVTVVARDGMPYIGNIEENGSYLVVGIPAGPVKIAVTSPKPPSASEMAATDAALNQQMSKKFPGPKAAPADPAKKWFAIPEVLSDPDKSGIATTVNAGPNTFPIDLK